MPESFYVEDQALPPHAAAVGLQTCAKIVEHVIRLIKIALRINAADGRQQTSDRACTRMHYRDGIRTTNPGCPMAERTGNGLNALVYTCSVMVFDWNYRMPTYIYETIPEDAADQPQRFEVFQKMTDEPLTRDPVSGVPVRQIITGGIGLKLKGLKRSTVVDKNSPAATACGCATGRPHRH